MRKSIVDHFNLYNILYNSYYIFARVMINKKENVDK